MSNKWYRNSGRQADTVISSRVRLARNIRGYPFPHCMSDAQREEIINKVCDASQNLSGLSLHIVRLSECSKRDVLAMVERHLISHTFASLENGVFLLSEDNAISIMINEEDHLRIQVMKPGMALEEAYELADKLDTALDEMLCFAFDERLGYLTQCPTNLGTGMRASLMLHLPAMKEQGAISSLAGTASKLGLTLRGAFGEGSRAIGAMVQLSNQITLGISEQASVANLIGVAEQIVEQELRARNELCADDVWEDRIWRSYGLLKSARLLTQEEALIALSDVRMGLCNSVLDGISLETMNALMTDIQAGCLMADSGEDMSPQVRDRRRAEMVRTALGGL